MANILSRNSKIVDSKLLILSLNKLILFISDGVLLDFLYIN